jgi:GNAT superfamily N-acetyltransferase
MELVMLDENSLGNLGNILDNYVFMPYSEYRIRHDLVVNFVVDKISDLLKRNACVLVAKDQGVIKGLVTLERLDWDSKHFGRDIAKIGYLLASGDYIESFSTKRTLLSQLHSKCSSDEVPHVFARVDKEDLSSIHALEGRGYRLMDVLVTYSFDLKKRDRVPPETLHTIRPVEKAELPKLVEIALECFRDNPVATDRFHADPTLPQGKSDDLYVKWLTEYFKESHGKILVAEMEGEPVGFNICYVDHLLEEKLGLKLGKMVLTAVKSSARGKLVAVSLLNAALTWFADKVEFVETGGQVSNYAIQRAWSRAGFKIIRSQCTFHSLPNLQSDCAKIMKTVMSKC